MPMTSDLFRGLSDSEVDEFLKSSESYSIELEKGESVFLQGDVPEYLFILEKGSVVVENTSISGKRSIVNKFSTEGTVFGEVYLYLNEDGYDYGCTANETSKIKYIPKKALTFDSESDNLKIRIINNMLYILSSKALYLNQKLLIASSFSIREKLAKYFIKQAGEAESIELPFTREELADFLGATRPSISRELMNMHNEGLIEVKNKTVKINSRKLEKFL
ncbi:MAG: Crp/Fnr family transcriptional regulator [Tissierellia bacterium]|nr:Crp/Fnr family transcriptional regulator [Tissierellia bacterium]